MKRNADATQKKKTRPIQVKTRPFVKKDKMGYEVQDKYGKTLFPVF